MKCKDSNFWIGLGIGSVAGALAYHFSRTEKAKKLEDAICRAIHKASGEAKEFINTAEEEALHVGTKVADKMAHEAHEAAEKADNLKTRFTILPMLRNKTSTWKLLKGCVKIHHRLHGLTQNELNLLIVKDTYLCKSV